MTTGSQPPYQKKRMWGHIQFFRKGIEQLEMSSATENIAGVLFPASNQMAHTCL